LFKEIIDEGKGFLIKAFPVMFLGVLVLNTLDILGIINFINFIFEPLFKNLFRLPGEAAFLIATRFLRKELAIGMLIPLVVSGTFNGQQLIIASVLSVIMFQCVATFAIMFKEMKKRIFCFLFLLLL